MVGLAAKASVVNFASAMGQSVYSIVPNLIAILFLIILGLVIDKILNKTYRKIVRVLGDRYDIMVSKMSIKFIIHTIIVVLIILNIPGINEGIIRTLGYILTAIIAFSSSTIIANLMSGVMMKIVRPFKEGNIVQIGDHIGEIAEIKMFHIVIETPKKQLITIPNSLVMSDSVRNFSKDSPVIEVKVSLGYDIDRIHVEKLLLEAARDVGLKNSFVGVEDLGNYSIVYVVNGMLDDIKEIKFIESNLRKAIIDQFHLHKMEILSPDYIARREVPKGTVVVPPVTKGLKNIVRLKEKREAHEAKVLEKRMFAEADIMARKAKHEKKKMKKGKK